MKARFLAPALLLLVSACTASAQVDNSTPTSSISSPSPSDSGQAAPSATLSSAQSQTNGRTRYTLDGELDYSNHALTVEETIVYTNRSDDELSQMLLVVEARRYPGAFELLAFQESSGAVAETRWREQAWLEVDLSSPLQPGDSATLTLQYQLRLPHSSGTFGYDERQINLANWYPFVPPYEIGQGWVVHPPGAAGEHLVFESADFEVTITPIEPSPDLTIAAPAPVQQDGQSRSYILTGARAFALAVGEDFLILRRSLNDVSLAVYAFPAHRIAAYAALQNAALAIQVYQARFGAYAYEQLTVVEFAGWDGLEGDGLFFLSSSYFETYDGSPANYLTALTAHETAHQWWYGQVGNDQATQPWLDEALVTYCEALFYEEAYPAWESVWWEFRIERPGPEGWVDGTIYDHASFDSYVGAVYLRGAQFMETLRDTVGDEAFFAFLRDYATQGSQRIMTGEDFFSLLREHSDADLEDVLGVYFAPSP
jgi:hypothetical protein